MSMRAYVVDALPVVREGITTWLRLAGLDVVGSTSSIGEAVRDLGRLEVDLVVTGHAVSGSDGGELCRVVREQDATTRCLLMLPQGRPGLVDQAVSSQVGYVFTDVDFPTFRRAVADVLDGRQPAPVSPLLTRNDNRPSLSEREHALLVLLAGGLSNREIAAELHVSVSWVKAYVSRLMTKLNARSRTEVVALAVRNDIVRRLPVGLGARTATDVRTSRDAGVRNPAPRPVFGEHSEVIRARGADGE